MGLYKQRLEDLAYDIEDIVEYHIRHHGMNDFEYKMTDIIAGVIDHHFDDLVEGLELDKEGDSKRVVYETR